MDGDKVVDRIYAGDLFGNLWVFDLSAANTNQWKVAYKQGSTPKPLFTATYSGTVQPITTKPILVKHPDNNTGNDPDVLVYFGTGQYLTTSDILNSDVQSFYGVWDHGTHSLTPSDLQEQTFLSGTFSNNSIDITSSIRVLTNNIVDYSSEHGWKIDLTLATGERVVVDPDVRGDVVFFNTWIPDTVVCNSGGTGFLMSVSQRNGGRTNTPVFDINGLNGVDSSDMVIEDSTNTSVAASGQLFSLGLPASSNFLSNKQYTPGTDGGSQIHTRDLEDLGDFETGRLSWQELR
jgi:type IV pilus assembly protein PilY1